MSNMFILIYSSGRGVKFMKHFKGGVQGIKFGNCPMPFNDSVSGTNVTTSLIKGLCTTYRFNA
jgi:hypothetical protein